jgi:hypothetical protein
MKSKWPFLLCFSLVSLFGLHAQTHSVLWIGNSYTATNNLPQLTYNLALSGGDTLIFDSNTPGGFTFQAHSTNAASLSKINASAWDFVVLQAQSQEPSFPPFQVETQTYPFARALDSIIRANNSCTETVFFMTWGRKYGDSQNCANYPPICTFEGMNNRLDESYSEMADDNEGIMAPVGLAWAKSRAIDSTINLWSADNSHPSLSGSYLSACVFYATLLRKSPVGLSYLGGLNASTANYLQNIAWQTVLEFESHCNIGSWDPVAEFTAQANGLTVQFEAATEAGASYLWDFGDGETASGNPISHTFNAEGDYSTTFIITDTCGISDTTQQFITLDITSSSYIEQSSKFEFYPNPCTSWLKINSIQNEVFEVLVINSLGAVVFNQTVNGKSLTLDFSPFAPGIYTLRCESANAQRHFKVIHR